MPYKSAKRKSHAEEKAEGQKLYFKGKKKPDARL